MGPVSHTVKIAVLGVNGITVSSCVPCHEGLAIHDENLLPVSAFVSFSRNKTAVTTVPSKPIGASPEGIELNMSDSDSEDEFGQQSGRVAFGTRGMRHVALWGYNEETMSQGCTLTLRVKLHKKGEYFEKKQVEVIVGLVRGDETAIMGMSVLNVTGPVPNMQFDLPLRRASGFESGSEKRNIFGGKNTPRAGFPRAENFGVGVVASRNSGQDELLAFKSDQRRAYGLDADATVRVVVSVISTKEYNELTKEQEAVRSMILHQMQMAQANHLGQPVIIDNFSAESPMSSISHTVFSASGDGNSVRSKTRRQTEQSRHSEANSRQSELSRRSGSRSKASSELSRERSMYLPPRSSGRPPQSNISSHTMSSRQTLQLTPFSPTLTQTGKVMMGNSKPPRPSPLTYAPNVPEQGSVCRTPLSQKKEFEVKHFFSPVSSVKNGQGHHTSRIDSSVTPKLPKGFKLKKVLKAFSPRTNNNNSALTFPNTLPVMAVEADASVAASLELKSSPAAVCDTKYLNPEISHFSNGIGEVPDSVPTLISGSVGDSLSGSTQKSQNKIENDKIGVDSWRSQPPSSLGSYKSQSPTRSNRRQSPTRSKRRQSPARSIRRQSPTKAQTNELVTRASHDVDKRDKETVETSTSMSDDVDINNEKCVSNSCSTRYTDRQTRKKDEAASNPAAVEERSYFSNKKLQELGISVSKEKSLYEKLLSGFFCKDELNALGCAGEKMDFSEHPPNVVVTKLNSDASVGDLTLTTFEQHTNSNYKMRVPTACGGDGVCASRPYRFDHSNVPDDELYDGMEQLGKVFRGMGRDEIKSNSSLVTGSRSKTRGSRPRSRKSVVVQEEEMSIGEDTFESILAAKMTLKKHADKLSSNDVFDGRGESQVYKRKGHGLWGAFGTVCRTSDGDLRHREEEYSDDSSDSCSISGSSSCSSSEGTLDEASTLIDENTTPSKRSKKEKATKGALSDKEPVQSRQKAGKVRRKSPTRQHR